MCRRTSHRRPVTRLACRGAMTRVHWWYHPDSYDEFIPAATAPADVEPDPPNSGADQTATGRALWTDELARPCQKRLRASLNSKTSILVRLQAAGMYTPAG